MVQHRNVQSQATQVLETERPISKLKSKKPQELSNTGFADECIEASIIFFCEKRI